MNILVKRPFVRLETGLCHHVIEIRHQIENMWSHDVPHGISEPLAAHWHWPQTHRHCHIKIQFSSPPSPKKFQSLGTTHICLYALFKSHFIRAQPGPFSLTNFVRASTDVYLRPVASPGRNSWGFCHWPIVPRGNSSPWSPVAQNYMYPSPLW